MDDLSATIAVTVNDMSQVPQARRAGAVFARQIGFSETDAGRLALVITEAATNLVRHGKGGQMLVSDLRHEGYAGVQLLALDKGPGIRDLSACLRDGYSTAGGAGTGLGAVQRLSSLFDIYSEPQRGTAVLVRIWAKRADSPVTQTNPRLRFGGVAVPVQGETVCGDAWEFQSSENGGTLIVADGLGHGSGAAQASSIALEVFRKSPSASPAELLELMHHALRGTRGAAVSVAQFSAERRVIVFAGVGNVSGAVISGDESRHLVCYPGTLGHVVAKIHEITYPWPQHSVVVLYSDGLTSHWSHRSYATLFTRHPALIAGALYRDLARGRDDATVVAAQES